MGFTEWVIVFAIAFVLFRKSTMRTIGRSVGTYSASSKPSAPQPVSPLAEYYRALDLPPTASDTQVREAYKELVKIWHPDRYMHDPKLKDRAEAKLKEINAAYEKLTAKA
jgi:DnaJ-domain-containing protein 1